MEFRSAHTLEGVERTEDIEIQENVTFDEMYLSVPVLSGLHKCGFVKPSPIQLSAIPLGRCGLDLIVQAKSGTGKTCVFSVVALEMISVVAKTTQVLIIAPTREIAVQIGQVINSIGSSIPELKTATFIGGTNVQDDKAKLKCCHIAIGTPGRLNQLVSLGNLELSNVRLLVLDEADELLTGQFKNCILELVKTVPFNKQVLALSATYPPEVTEFLDKFMRSPSHVRLGKESPALIGVHQFVRLLPDHPQSHQRHKIKFNELLSILSTVSFNQCLVFSNSQLRAESICNQLKNSGWPASFLTGGQIQQERLQAFFALCSYKCRILVSTDLSARGLDSEYVNLVINLDIPTDQATYLHRVGRAGRFGSKGIAVSLVCEGEEWETMRAVTTLTNVQVRILYDNYDSSTFEEENMEMVEHVSLENCALWLEKQDERKMKYKSKGVNKENISASGWKQKLASTIPLNQEGNPKDPVQKCIVTQDSQNEVQNVNKMVKDILHDYSKNPELYNFAHNDILNQILEKWETHSKCDNPDVTKTSYLGKYPSTSMMNLLSTFITSIDEKAEAVEISNTKDLKASKNLTDLVEDLQCVMQGIPLQLASNENVEYSTEKSNSTLQIQTKPENKEILQQNKENHICQVKNPVGDTQSLTTSPVSKKEKNSGIKGSERSGNNSANGLVIHDQSVRPKTQQKELKQKKYNENTGYGQWVTVVPQAKSSPRNVAETSEFYQAVVSPHVEVCKSISNSEHEDDSPYYYQESDDSSQVVPPLNTHYYSHNHYRQYCASVDGYMKSAVKFAEMMEYVKSVGRMSAWIAQNQNLKIFK